MDRIWNLETIYPSFDSEEFNRDYAEMKAAIANMSEEAEKKFSDPSNATEKITWYIDTYNEFSKFIKIFNFSSLHLAANVENEQAKKILDNVEVLFSDLTKPQVLFEKFVAELSDFENCISSSNILKEHEFMLRQIKDKNKYLLSKKEEIILSKLSPTGSSAWASLQSQLTAILSVDFEIDGKTEAKPLSTIRNMAYLNDAELRKKAYEAELKAYEKIDKPIAAAINSIKGEAIAIAKMRGYDGVLDMTLKNSRMDKQTLDALIGSMEEFMPSMRRFYKKKAEILGHKDCLPFYDLFAPIGEANMTFTYEKAADFVVKQFYDFSQVLGDFAKHAFENRWIDVDPRDGKTGGAFCADIHAIKQCRILTNFDGSLSDVLTLAHELGHAYHAHRTFSESYLNSDYPMPIAETASTFCETIVSNAALNAASDTERKVLLENMLTECLQVIVDIYSRFTFESELIAKREEGSLSVNELKELMISAQKKAYGDGLDQNKLHPYMWLCKSHYYSVNYNFYNFPYAYGLLFAKGLYSQFLKEGSSFVEKYDRLLTATGKNDLAGVAKIAGVDVRNKDFWRSSLALIEKEIDEFCRL